MRFALFLLGNLLILLALLARWLGLDHDAAWGASRWLLLVSGLVLAGVSLLLHLFQTGRISPVLRRRLERAGQAARGFLARVFADARISAALAGLVLLALCAYAAWFTSFGRFPFFARVANPYVELGEAFLHGQAALLEQPDPRLVALDNPYQPAQRETVPFRWDLSYYQGKYYAYWGPVPALLFAAAQLVTGSPPADQLGILVFYAALGGLWVLLLFEVRRRFYPTAPAASIVLFLLAALVNIPYAFLLARPQVYETSVLAGQFFLFGGIFAGLRWWSSHKRGWLAAAGLSWGLAAASRYNLAISVGLFCTAILYLLWREARFSGRFWRQSAMLLAPLSLCILALGLYNLARFDNPFETGLAYQLTVAVYEGKPFSAFYIPTNVYMYLLYPLKLSGQFPFVPSIPIQYNLLPGWVGLNPGWPYDEVFFGLLAAVPMFWLAGLLLPGLALSRVLARRKPETPAALPRTHLGVAGLLLLAALAQFGFLMFYYFGAMRFHADYFLLALLALLFLAWELDQRLRGKPLLRLFYWLVIASLALLTCTLGFFAAFDISPQFFRADNPELWHMFANRANGIYQRLAALPESPGMLGAAIRLVGRLLH